MSERGTKRQGALGRLWGAKPAARRAGHGDASEPRAKSGGWLDRLRQGLGKTSSKLSDGITGLFTKRKLGATRSQDLEDVLIEADLGLDTAERIITTLGKGRYEKGIEADDVRAVLKAEVERVLAPGRPALVDRCRPQAACHPRRRRQRHGQDDDDRQARRAARRARARR